MLETPHVAIGAALAVKVGNPYLAIPLALLSHFVLDRVPHWNPHFYTEMKKYGKPSKKSTTLAIIDSLVALGLGLTIAASALPDTNKAILVVVCSLMAVLPDQIKAPFFFFKDKRKGLLKKWVIFERSLQVDTAFWPGILTQVAVTAASLWWIYS
ncbi:MAG: hypothetical protein AAB656_00745 [Patescibacteria group bacterium]